LISGLDADVTNSQSRPRTFLGDCLANIYRSAISALAPAALALGERAGGHRCGYRLLFVVMSPLGGSARFVLNKIRRAPY